MQKTCLGIDPGIANTGYAIVSRNSVGKFTVLAHDCIQTKPWPFGQGCGDGSRYTKIYSEISKLLVANTPNIVAIERVFFNKNISSAMTTHGAIAISQLSAAQIGIETVLLKPQVVKAAIGFVKADKDKVKQMVAKLTGIEIRNSHAADAVAVAFAGVLHCRREFEPASSRRRFKLTNKY